MSNNDIEKTTFSSGDLAEPLLPTATISPLLNGSDEPSTKTTQTATLQNEKDIKDELLVSAPSETTIQPILEEGNQEQQHCQQQHQQQQEWSKGEVQPPQYRDVPYAIAFLLQLVFVLVVSVVVQTPDNDDDASVHESNDSSSPANNFFELSLSIIASIILTPIATYSAFTFMANNAEGLIKLSLRLSIGFNIFLGIVSLLSGIIIASFFFLFMAVLIWCYSRSVWNRIPYAATNIKIAIIAIKQNMGTILLALLSWFVMVLWCVFWFSACTKTLSQDFVKNKDSTTGNYTPRGEGGSGSNKLSDLSTLGHCIAVLYILSFYWTLYVIKNSTRTTVAGIIGTFWFQPQEASSFCSSAISDSLTRTTTYSLGSVCFGSLVVAILHTLRMLLKRVATRRRGCTNNFLICLARWMLEWIERLVEYINKWSFVYVGLYGYSYLEAGKNVMTLFKDRGWSVVIADSLVHRILTIICVCIGCGISLTIYILSFFLSSSTNNDNSSVIAFIVFILSTIISRLMMDIISSSVDTLLVCYAEAPQEFHNNYPLLYNELEESYTNEWPDVNFRLVFIPV